MRGAPPDPPPLEETILPGIDLPPCDICGTDPRCSINQAAKRARREFEDWPRHTVPLWARLLFMGAVCLALWLLVALAFCTTVRAGTVHTLTRTTTCWDDHLHWNADPVLSVKLAYSGRLVFLEPGVAYHLVGCWQGTIRWVRVDTTGTEQTDPHFEPWEPVAGQDTLGAEATGRFLDIDCSSPCVGTALPGGIGP